jgi:hypothetical protein
VTVVVTGFSVVVLVTDIVSVEIEVLYSGFGRLLTSNSAFPKGWIEGMGLGAIRSGGAALAEFSPLVTAMPRTIACVDPPSRCCTSSGCREGIHPANENGWRAAKVRVLRKVLPL